MIATKTLRSNVVTAWFCFLSGGLFAATGTLFLVVGQYIGLCVLLFGLVIGGVGFYYRKVGQRDA